MDRLRAETPTGSRTTPLVERIPDPRGNEGDQFWEREWHRNLLEVALERIKQKINPTAFEIFYLHVMRGQPTGVVARTLGINIARVYLSKHRVAVLLKKEVQSLKTKRF